MYIQYMYIYIYAYTGKILAGTSAIPCPPGPAPCGRFPS